MDELGKVDEIIPDPLGDEKLRNLVMSQDHLHLQGLWAFGKVGKVGKCSQILPKMMDAQLLRKKLPRDQKVEGREKGENPENFLSMLPGGLAAASLV